MEIPEIAKRIGKIESGRKIYMEDYVLAYLLNLKEKEINPQTRILLYGRKEQSINGENYVIYGAAENGEEYFKDYDEIGCLNPELWRKTKGMCEGILLGDGGRGQALEGYYIFYDEAQAMKEYMSCRYKEEIQRTDNRRRTPGETQISLKEKKPEIQAELVALSYKKEKEESPFYSVIRAVVIIIFIVFCAIAVTTVNSYEKIESFVEAAEQMNEFNK